MAGGKGLKEAVYIVEEEGEGGGATQGMGHGGGGFVGGEGWAAGDSPALEASKEAMTRDRSNSNLFRGLSERRIRDLNRFLSSIGMKLAVWLVVTWLWRVSGVEVDWPANGGDLSGVDSLVGVGILLWILKNSGSPAGGPLDG
jgi:hypothetical protein